MSLIDEARIASAPEESIPEGFTAIEEETAAAPHIKLPDLSILFSPTGEGPIEAYMEDPLNFDGKKSTARILRGFTGIFGALNYAIIDISIGLLEKTKEKKAAAAALISGEGENNNAAYR